VILFLLDKTKSRTEIENMKLKKVLKFDINYIAKKDQELKVSRDTLLKILEKEIRFTTNSDSIISLVYSVMITDQAKLSRHIDKGKLIGYGLPKNRIEIYGSTLSSIFTKLEDNLKVIIKYDLQDSTRYKMDIPRDNVQNLIAYFKDECGIDLIENEMKVEKTKVIFKD